MAAPSSITLCLMALMGAKSTRAALTVVAAVTFGAQPALTQDATRNADIYRGFLAVYSNNTDLGRAVIPFEQWSKLEFEAAIHALIARRNVREIEIAAVLHLEFALAAIGTSLASTEAHVELGARLMRALQDTEKGQKYNLPRSPDLPRFASTWYAVAASGYLSINDVMRGKPWLGMALAIAPRSAILHTYWGAAQELEAAEFYSGSWASESYRHLVSVDLRRRLLAAADSYRKAIEYDAAYAGAYLRLGRIQLFLGNLTDAQARFERARVLAVEPAHQYLSHLMLGGVLLEKNDLDGARASYERALAIVPRAQSATVAIGYLDVITGRPDLAQQRAQEFMATPVNDEYWWEYKNGGVYHAGLEWLRQRVRQ